MTAPGKIPFHPLADIFPLMQGEDFTALVADIREHGLRESIVLYEGKILDGRNRYRACIEAGVEPAYPKTFTGDQADAVAFVISVNIRRRHLTLGQKNDLIWRLLEADPEKSDRQIAKIANVGHPKVARVRKKAEAAGDVEHCSTRTDSKGRQQPATKLTRQATATPVVQATEEATVAEPAARDSAPAPLDALAELQRAWDAATAEVRQQFVAAEANYRDLRDRLAMVVRAKADETIRARATSTAPPSTKPGDAGPMPDFLGRSPTNEGGAKNWSKHKEKEPTS
jgi:ParB-like chromosome segregation protein Spo0J